MSACIIAAQIVMVPMAMLVGAKADAWGRKPLFLIGLLILPIRGMLLLLFWLAMPETRDAGAAEANLHQTDNTRRAEKMLIEAAPG